MQRRCTLTVASDKPSLTRDYLIRLPLPQELKHLLLLGCKPPSGASTGQHRPARFHINLQQQLVAFPYAERIGGKKDPPHLIKDRAWSATAGSMLVGMKPAAPASKAAQTSLGSSRSENMTSGARGMDLRVLLIRACC